MGHDRSRLIGDVHPDVDEVLAAIGSSRTDLGQGLLVQAKGGLDPSPRLLEETDVGLRVDDPVIRAQHLHQHEGRERIGHGRQTAAEVTAEGVAVVQAGSHDHDDLPEIPRDESHPDAGTPQRWVQTQGPLEQGRGRE